MMSECPLRCGRRVHDDVGAVFDRPRQDRRRHRGVHTQERAGAMGDLGGRGDVGDAPCWIGRGLDPHQLGGAGPDRGREGVGPIGVDEIDFQTPLRCKSCKPVAQRPVHHLGSYHMIAGRQCKEAGSGGAHARRKYQRLRAAFEGGQRGLGLVERRIVGARIDAAGAIAVVLVTLICARHMDRRHDGLRHRIDPAHRLSGERCGGEVLFGHQGHRELTSCLHARAFIAHRRT